MVENEVRSEYVREILGALGAKDFSKYAEDEELGILTSKNHMEEVVAKQRGEEAVNLGNEILYLRDRGLLEAKPSDDDIWVGVKHSQLTPPKKLIWGSETSTDYPREEPGWVDGPEGTREFENVNPREVLEVDYVIADAVKMGDTRISPGYIQKFIDGHRNPWPELAFLTAIGRGEIELEQDGISYIPNPEYRDEMEALTGYKIRNSSGPVYEFKRKMEPEDLQAMYEEGVEIVDEVFKFQ